MDRRYQRNVANKKKRKEEENEHREKEAQRTLAEHKECYDPNTSSNASETDSEADVMEESKTKCKQPKLSVSSSSVCAVADKHQVSHGLQFFYDVCFTISFKSITAGNGIWVITLFMFRQCSFCFFFYVLVFFICALFLLATFLSKPPTVAV